MAKTTRPMVRIHDLTTDEVIDREMNDEEYAEHLAQLEAQATAEAEALALAEAKTAAEAKLATLGLTADDLKALLG